MSNEHYERQTMVIWSTSEIGVFIAVIGMIILKLWSVWHVSLKAGANREGRAIFLGLLAGLTLFGLTAKIYISHVLS
ncbi:MAG: hypothetical protein GYB20_11945 [Oceanospirillales bacterium]|nr:hypothetical protein [Oceanospirillales bacterium]MBR9888387.1 hypothetical protein [Oceanospirillales bacterium]